MKPKKFAEQCTILEGKLPRAPDWPERSKWHLSKSGIQIQLELERDVISSATALGCAHIGKRFVSLLQSLGTMPGTLSVEMSP